MKIAFIVPYPIGKAPSQRFRFEQQFTQLTNKAIKYDTFPFYSEKTFEILYQKGKIIQKTIAVVSSFILRFLLLFRLQSYHYIFIHREASPIGPPFFEWVIAKWLKKKIIYDFDDAIWLPNTSDANLIIAKIKFHHKVAKICSWAYKVSCGNAFLMQYALQYNKNVHFIPTTVDTILVHNQTKNQDTEKLVIGWTGTHSTIQYLYKMEALLTQLQKKYSFEFIVISNKDPEFKQLKYTYKAWQKDSEITDLLNFNIGIMPLKNDVWAEGKCGFKAIQYMALGIPAIVSNVGVNATIVNHAINGFVCNNDTEWQNAIVSLLTNTNLRKQMGANAQQKIINAYSTLAVQNSYLNLFAFTV
jgi:glycosyltransferase involved in cell wall biosynthesis